jgi:hypothetical protein
MKWEFPGLEKSEEYLWFEENHPDFIECESNGCGPGGILAEIVPDNPFGFPFGPACNIHDIDWTLARNDLERKEADERFHRNLRYIVMVTAQDAIDRWFGMPLADQYHESVAVEGARFFWRDAADYKNERNKSCENGGKA